MKSFTKVLALAFAAVFCVMAARAIPVVVPKKSEKIDISRGMEYLTRLDSVTPAQAEKAIRDAQERRERQTAAASETQDGVSPTQPDDTDSTAETETETDPTPETETEDKPVDMSNYTEKQREILEAIDDGNFDYAFRDTLIVGDSLVKGLTEYEKLDSSYVIAEIGGGTSYLQEVMWDIISINPRNLVIHIGENELDTEDYCSYFIERYKDSLSSIMDYLPDTQIYVESIFPVLDHALDDEPYLVNIDYYNDHLREMAAEMGVHFIDYDSVFASFPRSYYELDGIHQLPEFYDEQYMPHILREVYSID